MDENVWINYELNGIELKISTPMVQRVCDIQAGPDQRCMSQ